MAKKKSTKSALTKKQATLPVRTNLFGDIRHLIEAAREQTARAVNSTLVIMYWKIGQRLREDVLQNERAEYGKEILQTLSAQLSWSHFTELIRFEDGLKRDFYAEMCRIERWSVRTLRHEDRLTPHPIQESHESQRTTLRRSGRDHVLSTTSSGIDSLGHARALMK
jgi:hypothetical protein